VVVEEKQRKSRMIPLGLFEINFLSRLRMVIIAHSDRSCLLHNSGPPIRIRITSPNTHHATIQ
jgi:hypothetical protein